ncbi:hypothetical protein NDU88_000845 [Pleurodeles waltl]|uniref:Uncharacterized protein n=1 Tax=Pleurodeles waltl TaxID=8319 RepID=A0AAV7WKH2_PLEWA|nr:hypothetical protein NDU88_000845 [Pleurodeles waltl]
MDGDLGRGRYRYWVGKYQESEIPKIFVSIRERDRGKTVTNTEKGLGKALMRQTSSNDALVAYACTVDGSALDVVAVARGELTAIVHAGS